MVVCLTGLSVFRSFASSLFRAVLNDTTQETDFSQDSSCREWHFSYFFWWDLLSQRDTKGKLWRHLCEVVGISSPLLSVGGATGKRARPLATGKVLRLLADSVQVCGQGWWGWQKYVCDFWSNTKFPERLYEQKRGLGDRRGVGICLCNIFMLLNKFPGSFCNCKEFKIRL